MNQEIAPLAATDIAEIGHNNPPSDREIMRDDIAEKYRPAWDRGVEIVATLDRAVKEADEINDEAMAERVLETIDQSRTAMSRLEEVRKEETKPLRDRETMINDIFREVTAPISSGIETLRRRLGSYQSRKALAQKVVAAAEGDTKAALAPVKQYASVKASSGASAGVREDWTIEIVNFDEIPREFLVLNERAVKEALKAKRVKSVPGLKIDPVHTSIVRGRRA